MENITFEQIVKLDEIIIKINNVSDYIDLVEKFIKYKSENISESHYDNSCAWKDKLEKGEDNLRAEMNDWCEENDVEMFYVIFEENNIYDNFYFEDYCDYGEYEYVANLYEVELL